MEYSALGKENSTHKIGSKLFDEVVALYRKDKPEYNKILATAHSEAVGNVIMDNKTLFKQWLTSNPPKKLTVEKIIQALDDGSDYCCSHSISKESFWNIADRSKFTAVTSKLLGMRFFRLTHRNTAAVLDKAVPLYKEFLMVSKENETVANSNTEVQNNSNDITELAQNDVSKSAPNGSNDLRKSLEKTTEYLKTRYDVRLHYDHLSDPGRGSNDMLYKVRNSKKDIMWVYYIDSKSARYISIETEPEYLEDMSRKITGFTRIQTRTSHPCRKMFFEDYESIKESLEAICDSIDQYFVVSAPLQPQEDRMKLYQKLYSISRVYDDPSGLSISRIMSLLGKDADENLVRSIMDDVSWATKLTDEVYSFSC